jgi:Leucine-rich repeat (LRR) protein
LTSLEIKGHKGSQILSFEEIPNLKQLTINGYSASTLLICQCPSLETLTIRFNVLTSWDFLKGATRVQNLTLNQGYFDTWNVTGVTADTDLLVKILIEHCRDIKTLKIYRLKVTADQLEKIVYSLPNLQKLIIFQTEDKLLFTAKKLQEAKPAVKIVVPEVKFVYVSFFTNQN